MNTDKTARRRPEEPGSPTVYLEDVSFDFSGETLFENLNFTVPGGEWTCLIGPSGCGKSTLLRMISGSLRDGLSGVIRFSNGRQHAGLTAWMAQKDLLLPWLSVVENVCLGARLRGDMSNRKRARAWSLLEQVGLGDYCKALPSELSGGMRQRVALLRTLMEDRPVILMDEPFSALDALTRLKLQDLAAAMLSDTTVLMVTHDPQEALRLGHRIYVMNGRPARLGEPLVPPGNPPRKPGDPQIAALQAVLLERLNGGVRL